MVDVTYYVALPFGAGDDGVAAGELTECFNPNAAVMRVEALSRKEGHVGAVAFCRTGDPATGDFRDADVNQKVRRRSGRSERVVMTSLKEGPHSGRGRILWVAKHRYRQPT
jgi:hypothetical protein